MTTRSPFRALIDRREGSVLVMFALIMTVLFALVGGAIDVSRAFSAKAHLQLAADAAALAGANDPYDTDYKTLKVARDIFESSKTNLDKQVNPTYKVTRQKTAFAAEIQVSASASVDTSLLKVIGIKNIDVAVVASARRQINAIDVYAVVDMSASMGIAADEANRLKMVELTRPYTYQNAGCAFACHFPDSVVTVPAANTYDFARQNNVRLREDVMKDAFSAFVNEMLDPNDSSVANGQRRVATYGFSDNLTKLSSPGSTIASVTRSLDGFPDSLRKNSRFVDVLPQVTAELGTSGNGSIGNPKKMLLLVTDGVQWMDWPRQIGGPFDGSLCNSLKTNGVEVAVLEVKYFEDVDDTAFFGTTVQPFYPQITPGLKACASPGLYFKVADSTESELKAAFAAIAQAMKPKLALTR